MASLRNLTEGECSLVLTCIRAVVDGPFLPDWEFETVMGISREQARAITQARPRSHEALP